MEFNQIHKSDELQQPLVISSVNDTNNSKHNLLNSTILSKSSSSNIIKRYSPTIDISDYLKKEQSHSCSNTIIISDNKNNNHSNITDEEVNTDISKNLNEILNEIKKNVIYYFTLNIEHHSKTSS